MRNAEENRRPAVVRGVIVAAVSTALILIGALPAAAIYEPDPVETPRDGFITEVTITGSQYPSNVTGELTPLGPAPAPYPATGASVEAVSPQLITIADPATGTTASAYCIDFSTETGVGAGYKIGEWDASNVPNLTYINYILTNYFPFNTANPISALTPAQQVAAVQTAIWYFSDGFVLATGTNPIVRNATALVVQNALDSGGLPEPPLPTLAIDPATSQIPATGEVVGPFTVSGDITGTLDVALGVEVFFDAAATQPVTSTDPIPPGTRLWARWTGPALPINGFRVTGVTSLTQGTVYLYDPESSGLDQAQKLVLAQTTTLPIRAGVRVESYAAGSLTVQKVITGSAAGWQGEITIQIACVPQLPLGVPTTAVIPAGATAPEPIVFSGIPDGASCTVSEPTNGATASVNLTAQRIEPASVTVSTETTATVSVTNAYEPVPADPVEPTDGSALAASGPDSSMGALGLAGIGLLVAGLLIHRRRSKPGAPHL